MWELHTLGGGYVLLIIPRVRGSRESVKLSRRKSASVDVGSKPLSYEIIGEVAIAISHVFSW